MKVNQIIVAGNITREPELKELPGGTSVCNFSIAFNDDYEKNGEWTKKVCFFNVVTFGELSKKVADMKKGIEVIVIGKLTQRSYTDKDNNNRQVFEINAVSVQSTQRLTKSENSQQVDNEDYPF